MPFLFRAYSQWIPEKHFNFMPKRQGCVMGAAEPASVNVDVQGPPPALGPLIGV